MRHLDSDEALQLVIVGQVNQTETASAKDFFHPVATDVLRCRIGSFVHGCWLIWTSEAAVVHGQSSSR
jgi:hypothetical protein